MANNDDLKNSIRGAADTAIEQQTRLVNLVDDYKTGLQESGVKLGDAFKLVLSVQTQVNKSLSTTLDLEEALTDKAILYNRLQKSRVKIESEIEQVNKRIADQKARLKPGEEKAFNTYKALSKELEKRKKIEFELRDNLISYDKKQSGVLATLQQQFTAAQQLRKQAVTSAEIAATNIQVQAAQAALSAKQVERDKVVANLTSLIAKKEQEITKAQEERDGIAEKAKPGIQLDLLRNQLKALKETRVELDKIAEAVPKFDKIRSSMKDMAEHLGKFAALTTSVGLIGNTIKGWLDYLFQVDNQITSVSKNSGLTKESVTTIRDSYRDIAKTLKTYNSDLNSSLLTVRGQLDAQMQLQSSTETLSLYSNDRLQSQIYLTKQVGLEAEEATKLADLAIINNKSTKEVYDTVTKITAQVNKETGLRLNHKAIMRDVAKASGLASANYKNDPKALAEAVAQAKALGTTLESTLNTTKALLNWEQSIEDQLEFEVLSGKAVNLERARSLALTGKTVEAEKEILKQFGKREDFESANYFVKEAAAKMLGKSTDELANQFRLQELLKNSSIETKKAYEEQLTLVKDQDAKKRMMAEAEAATDVTKLSAISGQVSKQLEFEESVERVKEVFSDIVRGPLGNIVKNLSESMSSADGMKWALKAMGIYAGVVAASSMATALATIATAMAIPGGQPLAMAALGVLGLGAAAGLGLGIYAGNSTNSKVGTINDGLISPSGQIMISTPQGMIKPNANDSIIATTNPGALLGGAGSSKTENIYNQTNTTKTEQLLSAILVKINQPAPIYMNGDRLTDSLGKMYTPYA